MQNIDIILYLKNRHYIKNFIFLMFPIIEILQDLTFCFLVVISLVTLDNNQDEIK